MMTEFSTPRGVTEPVYFRPCRDNRELIFRSELTLRRAGWGVARITIPPPQTARSLGMEGGGGGRGGGGAGEMDAGTAPRLRVAANASLLCTFAEDEHSNTNVLTATSEQGL